MSYLTGSLLPLVLLIIATGLVVLGINAFRHALEASWEEVFSGKANSIFNGAFCVGCSSTGSGIFLVLFAIKLIFA